MGAMVSDEPATPIYRDDATYTFFLFISQNIAICPKTFSSHVDTL